MVIKFKKLEFTNAGGQRLSARIDLPEARQPVAYALFAHCFTCSKNIKAISHISRALTRKGIAVLRFDFTGLGESEGDFADTNFSSNVSDLVMAAKFMADYYDAPKILIGHSLGGAAVLQAAAEIPSATAVITIAAPAEPAHVSRALGESREIIEQAEVDLSGRTFKIKNLNRALLVLHSPLDDIVGIENAAKIFQTARHPKSFISLDSADHLLMDREDSLYAGSIIATWAQKYADQ